MNFEILETMDYDKFKTLDGNRAVTEARARKIMRSIEQIGYIPVPIVVNEKYEVIDGQGRLTACKNLNLPIYYIVVDGIGAKECQWMNINQTNWKTEDYIHLYCANDNPNYLKLDLLLKKYSHLKVRVVCGIAKNVFSVQMADVREGRFKLSDDEFQAANKKLEWLLTMHDALKRISGHTELLCFALSFAYDSKDVNNDRMQKALMQNWRMCSPGSTIAQALDDISDVYNKGLVGRNRIYLKTDYMKYMNDHYAWYDEKWGGKNDNDCDNE